MLLCVVFNLTCCLCVRLWCWVSLPSSANALSRNDDGVKTGLSVTCLHYQIAILEVLSNWRGVFAGQPQRLLMRSVNSSRRISSVASSSLAFLCLLLLWLLLCMADLHLVCVCVLGLDLNIFKPRVRENMMDKESEKLPIHSATWQNICSPLSEASQNSTLLSSA